MLSWTKPLFNGMHMGQLEKLQTNHHLTRTFIISEINILKWGGKNSFFLDYCNKYLLIYHLNNHTLISLLITSKNNSSVSKTLQMAQDNSLGRRKILAGETLMKSFLHYIFDWYSSWKKPHFAFLFECKKSNQREKLS